MPVSRGVITLVHGTFARRARWIRPGSKIFLHLRRAGYEVEAFQWSGRNSFRARSRAADQLRLRLEENASRRPGLRQIVIAHSHGGNVALLATSRITSPLHL